MVFCSLAIDPQKVPAIVRQQNASGHSSEGQNFLIWHGRVCVPRLQGTQYVVAELPQLFHHLHRDIFVRIKPGHLCGLIFTDLCINFRKMCARISPRIYQIFRSYVWISLQKLPFGRPQPPCLFEKPHRNSGPNQTRLAPTHILMGIDSGKRTSQVLHYPFENLSLFSPRKRGQHLFKIAQSRHTTSFYCGRTAARTGLEVTYLLPFTQPRRGNPPGEPTLRTARFRCRIGSCRPYGGRELCSEKRFFESHWWRR